MPSRAIKNSFSKEGHILHDLGTYYSIIGDYNKAIEYNNIAIGVFEKCERIYTGKKLRSVLSSKAKSIANIGDAYSHLGDYSLSIDYHKKALKIAKQINDTLFEANSLRGIGRVYTNNADYPKALEYYFAALKLTKLIKNKGFEGTLLDGIGTIYNSQKDFDKALSYYLQALQIKIEVGEHHNVANFLSNIGGVYFNKKQYQLALMYLNRAYKIAKEVKNKRLELNSLAAIGSVYKEIGDSLRIENKNEEAEKIYVAALDHYKRSLSIAEEMKSKSSITVINGNIGEFFYRQKRYKDAENYLLKALASANEIQDLEGVKEYNQLLSLIYQEQNNFAKSLEHFKKYIDARDTISNEENTKQLIRSEMNFEFEKRENITKAEQEKRELITASDSKRQKIIIQSICCVLALVLIFAIFVYRNFLQKQRINVEISNQKKIIEEKQKEVLDSIYYARRIQRALITSEGYIENNLKRLLGKK